MGDFERFKDKYVEDAGELITQLEEEILRLEKHPNEKATVQEIFRLMHTLKGSAGMFGFEKIGELTHHVETVYDMIRNSELTINRAIIDLTFKSVDLVKSMLYESENLNSADSAMYASIIVQLNSYSKGEEIVQVEVNENENATNTNIQYFYIHYAPSEDIFTRGIKPLSVFEELRELGQVKSIVNTDRIPDFKDFNRKIAYTEWQIFIATTVEKEEVEDVFMFFMEEEYSICEIHPDNIHENECFLAKNKKISSLTNEQLQTIFEQIKLSEEDLKSNTESTVTQTIVAEAEEAIVKEEHEETRSSNTDGQVTTIRVASEKLDDLINLVSELVTVNSQLELLTEKIGNQELTKAIKTVSKLSKRFRDNALEMRLVPINVLMISFKRLVRDLSQKLNKKIEFVTEGVDTELDKTIINQLESPLMHIIRNSIDHGIESAAERARLEKPEAGIIRFIAFYSGASVFIQVQDDGGGIDPEKIRKKAIDKGFINPKLTLTKKELLDLIFLPGFSTAQSLTEVSGRGVGMDVVRQKIGELRGEIEIDSELNLGTSVTLKLPLTLSIIDTLHVQVSGYSFLLPLSSIESCKNIDYSAVSTGNHRQIEYNDQLIAAIHMREDFNMAGESNGKEKVVIIKQIDRKYAIVVDKVIGEHQAVVKPLGFLHKKQEYLSGATILGDGKLALIIDTNKLVKLQVGEHIANIKT